MGTFVKFVKFLLVAILVTMKIVNGQVHEPFANSNFAECTGSLAVMTNINGIITTKKFSESKKNTGLDASSLEVEGCGCFYLYKRSNFKSSSKLVTHHMTRDSQNISGDYIGFKIRSIEKVSCEGIKYDALEGDGLSFWIMVGFGAGVSLLVVTLMAVAGVKCYRKYRSTNSSASLATSPLES